jgi:hypothetical protein
VEDDRQVDFFERASYPADVPADQEVMHPHRPLDVMGASVALDLLLARSSTAAVRVQHLIAFPTGFEFEVVAQFRPTGETWDPMHGLAGLRGKPGDEYGALSDEHLRFGVQFADGRKATNVGPPMWGVAVGTEGPMLHPGGGGAGASMANTTYWVWPLPPPGPLAFVCEWPKYGIPLTRQEIDGEMLLAAAAQAVDLWPEAPV